MQLTPDDHIWWQFGLLRLNSTILFTWGVMALVTFGSWLATRRLLTDSRVSRMQHLLEIVVHLIEQQLNELSPNRPKGLLPFVGTLFLFIAVCNLLAVVPGFEPPTGSLSTTAGLAICVFLAVPIYGINAIGVKRYVGNYLRPTPFMLPFNIMGEFSRTLALSVRLFGNVMSGTMIGAILLIIAPLIVPILMQLLGLLTGMVQAYIFAILSAVYISAGMEVTASTGSSLTEGGHAHGENRGENGFWLNEP
jgi:F-type H+-transporting ATPase subunit a